MLRPLLLLFFAFGSAALLAQFASPIRWEFSYERVQGDEFRLIAKASAEAGWAIYSQYTPDGGPIPTSFMWTKGKHFELVGKSEEKGHRKSGMDEMFGVEVIKFLSDEPTYFTQRVVVKDYATPIEVAVEYMCCDDEQCLPPTDVVHSFVLPPSGPRQGANTSTAAPGAVAGAGDNSGNPGTGNAGSQTSSAPRSDLPPSGGLGGAPAAAPYTPTTPLAIHTAVGTAATADDPVSWVFTAEQLAPNQYRLRMTGNMREGWTMYSKDVDPDPGAIPTEFFVKTTDGVTTLGPVEEISATLKVKYDKVWGADMAKIEGGNVVYQQTVALNGAKMLEGYVYYQTCDDEMCFPPKEVPFTLDLSGPTPVASVDGLTGQASSGGGASVLPANELGITVAFDPAPVGTCSEGEEVTAGQGMWTIFGLGFIGGLFAMLMPCIFPMIPLTVSFFTKSGGTRAEGIRRASLYGFFIFLIYVLLSLPFHLLDGLDPGILNTIASSVPLNVAFFLIFLFFAGSFFGFYELTLPESWSNRASRAEGAGGIIGIFFMALTLALVSFSCTGPILGSLLVEAVSDGAWPLTAGMAGFGVALGLPFALFAAFPGFLNNLPKSGGWLNSVKVVLGFVEIALAFKFLSNADLVGEWDLLRIEPFLLIWILCALGIAAYLFKLISFPLDSKKRKIGVIGGVVGGAGIAFTAYLLLGLTTSSETGTYRNLSLLSGIAPPVCYNYFLPCDATRNITPFKNLEEGLAYARQVNKPVMLDFTGYTCVNCRKMEENVWTENEVKRYLTDEYVIISLYTDDRSALPPAEHREVQRLDGSGRTLLINEVGKKWHYFQQTVYARSSQPYYVLVSPDGVTLNPPVAYTPDVEEYKNFLACGLSTYQRLVSSK
ncbi:cytochrome c biogenesis protein CcdA [Neolewinella lacunae]|uniref:Thioredoxin family protein n=1 Tax=Neolewinella lacunae TaxID=1517758 RepID=A0A923PKB9_9BACT|nr:thioredoxin family protein [Neolewinella lacunae]MBC6995672.1 thioredoxin family protein [Neolewinella lacunae]MDN3634260.1 cytochrome c biogenesis protein CcdA [Neolewinella lacunae]